MYPRHTRRKLYGPGHHLCMASEQLLPFQEAGSIKQEEGAVEDIWRQKIHCAVSYCTCGDRVREEGEKGVGSVPMMQCKVGKVSKEVGC